MEILLKPAMMELLGKIMPFLPNYGAENFLNRLVGRMSKMRFNGIDSRVLKSQKLIIFHEDLEEYWTGQKNEEMMKASV
jgi:hypothetical protein